MEIQPIAYFRSPMKSKFGIPRQSGLVSELTGCIVFEPAYRRMEAIHGLEDFDYLFGLQDADAIYERVRTLCSTLILTDGARSIRVYEKDKVTKYDVQRIKTVSTVGAGDNFNAGYIYAKMRGINDQSSRIAMAQRWSQDVCQQIGNNISDELVAQLKV